MHGSAINLSLDTVSSREETSATRLHRLLGDTPLLAVRPPLGFDVARLDGISINIHTSPTGKYETQINDDNLACSANNNDGWTFGGSNNNDRSADELLFEMETGSLQHEAMLFSKYVY